MMVRRLFFLPKTSSLENLSMQSLSLLPYLTASLSLLSLSLTIHTCAVSSSSFCFLPPRLSFPVLPVHFPICMYPPSLLPPHRFLSSHSGHLLLVFMWKILGLGLGYWESADFHLGDHTNFLIMFGHLQFPSHRLMELHCRAGICLHATGRDSIPVSGTYIASHLHKMRCSHSFLTALLMCNGWLCTATHCNSNLT